MVTPEDSTPAVPAAHGALAAWPLLAGLQVVLAAICVGVGVALLPPAPVPVADRLATLDPTAAAQAVAQARAAADTGRALAREDEEGALRFLDLLARASELELLGARLRTGVARDGAQPVDAVLTLSGDPYHLPIFLDGLYRQRRVSHLLSVQGSGAGTLAEFSVIVRYYRPLPVDPSWVPVRLAHDAPGVDAAALSPVLQDALELAAWRRFQAEEPVLLARAAAVRREVARAISPALIHLRRAGGAVSWRYTDPGAPSTTLN